MLIVCPRCETTFTLPDALYKPGKKARCSNCGLVFAMSAPVLENRSAAASVEKVQPVAVPAPDKKLPFHVRYRKALTGSTALFLLFFLGYGAWLIIGSFAGGSKAPVAEHQTQGQEEAPAQAGHERLISGISLGEIRQFQVDNTLVGKIMVIQGVAVNVSDSYKDFITIEARILDANGNTLGEPVQQLCGVSLTLFQLQSLNAEELRTTLNNRITILTYNTSIAPGGTVPFVVIFPSPPANMKKFEVRVISVRDAGAT